MDHLLNRLEISFCNLTLTKNIDQKEAILNKALVLIRYYRIVTDLMHYLYSINPELFQEFITKFNKPSLILLTYDLEAIGKAIGLSNDNYIVFRNNTFHVEYKPISPKSDSTHSIHSEWGY